jgi:hypothetical protein
LEKTFGVGGLESRSEGEARCIPRRFIVSPVGKISLLFSLILIGIDKMDPCDLVGPGIVICWEGSESDRSRINIISFYINTKVDIGVVLVIVVGSGYGLQCADISQGLHLVVLPF